MTASSNALIWWWSVDLLPKPTVLPKWAEKVALIVLFPVIVYLIIQLFIVYLDMGWISSTITTLLIIGFFTAAGKLGEKAQEHNPIPPSLSDRKIEVYTNGIKYNLFSEYTNTSNDFYSLDTILVNTINIGIRFCSINGNWGLSHVLLFKVNYMDVPVKLPLIGIGKKDISELKKALDMMKKG